MAITFFGGPPGAGKSYALVEQVIVPGVMAGRRVVTNVAGVDPVKVLRYCEERSTDHDALGDVILFDGAQAVDPGFFPTEQIPDSQTFLKGGDLLVFDEWRLYWPRRGTLPSPDLEPFLRWHRHLVDAKGVATEIAIASQLPTDVHQDFRGLIERSYKFKKLKAVGLTKAYAWDVYEGHLQPKGGSYGKGNGTYKDEITALYSSYATTGSATELSTDKRASIFKSWLMYAGCGGLALFALSAFGVYRFFTSGSEPLPPVPVVGQPGNVVGYPPPGQSTAPVQRSDYRIVGHILGDDGVRVVVVAPGGSLRVVAPDGFTFDGERPVSGYIDGKQVFAEDRVKVDLGPAAAPGFGL